MSDKKNKSVTIRINSNELSDWYDAQTSPVFSVQTAIKICMLCFGKDVDLLDAVLKNQFSSGDDHKLLHALSTEEKSSMIESNDLHVDEHDDKHENNVPSSQDVVTVTTQSPIQQTQTAPPLNSQPSQIPVPPVQSQPVQQQPIMQPQQPQQPAMMNQNIRQQQMPSNTNNQLMDESLASLL